MKEVKLANSDRVAIVDDKDFELVSLHRWFIHGNPHSDRLFHAKAMINGQLVSMQRFILGHLPGFIGDHINHDGLDNRRSNLRVTTQWHNSINRRMNRNNTSGFRGVSSNGSGRWAASITHLGKAHFLGSFPTPEEAARAFDMKALELRGAMAILNFPREGRAA